MISLRTLFFCFLFLNSLFFASPRAIAQESQNDLDTTALPDRCSHIVSLAAYNDFLNAVAATDEHHLYSEKMQADGLIVRIGSRGNYCYFLIDASKALSPIRDLHWFSMARYCNWQENNCPRTREEDLATTETGAYALNEVQDENSTFPSLVKQKQGASNTIDSSLTINLETDESEALKSNPDPLLICNKLGFSTAVVMSNDPFSFLNGNNASNGGNIFFQDQAGANGNSLHQDQEGSAALKEDAPPLILLMSVLASQQASVNPFCFDLSKDMVIVDDRNNEPDKNGRGAIDHDFKIDKFDVTAAQWCSFLNAVARQGLPPDPYDLYNDKMQSDAAVKCIKRTTVLNPDTNRSEFYYEVLVDDKDVLINTDGTKTVIHDRGQFPITYVSYFAAVRFCNWLSNGQPNIGEENILTTEDGPYTITGDKTKGYTVIANFGAGNDSVKWPHGFYRLPTEDEWYKAAYYQKKSELNDPQYWIYSTGKAVQPFNSMKAEDNDEKSLKNVNFHYIYDDKISGKHVDQYTTVDPPYLTPVGEFKNSPGPFGTFDMGGNVDQWTDPQFDPGIKDDPGMRNWIRGGSWQSTTLGDVGSGVSHVKLSSDSSSTVGFRVVLIEPEGSIWNRTVAQWDDDFKSMKDFCHHPEKYYDTMDYHMGIGVGYTVKKILQVIGYLMDYFMSLIQQGIYYLSPEMKAYLSRLPISVVRPLEDFWLSAISLQAKYKGFVMNESLTDLIEARKKCFVKIMEVMKSKLVDVRTEERVTELLADGQNEVDIAAAQAAIKAEAEAAVDQKIKETLVQLYGPEVGEAVNPVEEAAEIASRRVPQLKGLVTTQGENISIEAAVEKTADEAASRLIQKIETGAITSNNFRVEIDRLFGSMTLDLGEAEVATQASSLIAEGFFYTYGMPLLAVGATLYLGYSLYEGGEGAHNTRFAAGVDLASAFFVGEFFYSLIRLKFPALPAVPGFL